MENFRTDGFEEAVRTFATSVTKLQTVAGMQAENDQRKADGADMTYVEDDFVRLN